MSPNIFRRLCVLFTKVQILAVVFDSLHVFLHDEIPSLFIFSLIEFWKNNVNIRTWILIVYEIIKHLSKT